MQAGRGRGAVLPAWMSAGGATSAPGAAAPSAHQPAAAHPGGANTAAAVQQPSGSPLPPGWMEAFDEQYKHPYWYNHSTGERTWTRPVASVQPPRPAVPPPLPPGWQQAQDPGTGRTYYYNAALGQTQWTPPAVGGAPAAAAVQGEVRAERQPRPQQPQGRAALDPMDPSAYSDAPRGNWGAGLGQE